MADCVHSLTAGLAAGDPRAVEVFYRRYFDRLYAQARRASGRDEAFCLDVVQESVLRVLRSIRPASSEAQLCAWLRLVVQTTAYDLLRSETRRQRRELLAVGSKGYEESRAEPADAEQLEWLRSQIAALDPEIAHMIEMRFTDRWTLARIARRLGLSIGTVDGRLRRALRHLRDRAREDHYE
ncbi:MAG: polymerase sigma factor, sigma-70 family [Phycisphaerales bacterium]|nr:polymerase sigma factor, sigma-70 family [Phycisphaerales bacterium]